MPVETMPARAPQARAAGSHDAPRTAQIGRQLRDVFAPPPGLGGFEDLLRRLDQVDIRLN